MHDESRRSVLELILIGVLLSVFVAGAVYTLQDKSERTLEIEAIETPQ